MRKTLLILTFLLIPGLSRGQDNPALPDLAPHVVEITGELSISFPSLRRQPLIGFNPPPRVPEIPTSRRPFLELYKQSTDELPPSPLSAPEPPEVSSLANRTPHTGLLETGIGRFVERYFRANLSVPVADQTRVVLSARYQGSDGHEPFVDTPSITTESDISELFAGIHHTTESVQIGGNLDLYRSAYSLFGSEHSSGSPLAVNPDRTVSGWDLSGFIGTKTVSTVAAKLKIGMGRSQIDTDLFDTAEQSIQNVERSEGRLILDGSLRAPISDSHVSIEGNLLIQNLELVETEDDKISSWQIGGTFRLFPGEGVTLDAGFRVLGFDAQRQSRSSTDRSLVFLSPDFRLIYSIRPGAELVLSNKPEISRSTIRDVYYLAPYIEDIAPIQPVLMPLHLSGRVNLYSEFVHATAGIGVKEIENYRIIESPSFLYKSFNRGYMSVDYGSASITYLDGSVTMTLAPGLQGQVDISFRRGRLDDTDAAIPYFSPVTFGASVAVGLFDGRLSLKMLARGESERYRDRTKSKKLDSVLLFDTEGTWYLTPQAGITFGIRNLGGSSEFWDNYEIETSVIYAGARWRW